MSNSLLVTFLCVGMLLFGASCKPLLHTSMYQLTPVQTATARVAKPPVSGLQACNQWQGYLPDLVHSDHMPIKVLRVNFHILNSRDSSHNFKPDSARAYFRRLLDESNAELDRNERNWRSTIDTKTLPKRYRYMLWPQADDDGFYFHYDDSLYWFVSMGKYQNNYSRKVIDKYVIGKDTIFNIFVQVHPDDSLKSRTYRANGQGIALGTSLKMAGIYESKESPLSFNGLLNHEIGHILGLGHAWAGDGCDDTQDHPNRCWVWTEAPGFCHDNATNNMMDYNAYQIALTPCQIGKIQATFANERNAIRKCLVPNWCTLHPDRPIIIRDSIAWTGARDLESNLVIAPGGVLHLSCRLSMPPGGSITVQPGGLLILDGCRLHQACDKTWKGIEIQEIRGLKGVVEVRKRPEMENLATDPHSN